MQEEKRQLAAIMFTDIVGYTTLMSIDERKSLQFLQKQREILKPLIKQYNGKWLKEMGDGTISSFHSTLDAVNCAVEIQQALQDDSQFKLRIGIHIGDIIFSKGDVFGDGVNVASRIEPIAAPGGICISDRVHDDIINKPDLSVVLVGEKSLKNVKRPMKVYAITGGGLPVPMHRESTAETSKRVIEENVSLMKKRVSKGEIIFGSLAVVLFFFIFIGWIIPSYLGSGANENKIDSIAIVPFQNTTLSEETYYLNEGIPESIISNLQELPDMRLFPFSSSSQLYSDKTPLAADVGKDLNVKSVVLGKISQLGDDLIINIEIVDTRDIRNISIIFVYQYIEKSANLMSIQTKIAVDITAKLKFYLTKKALMASF